MLLRAFIIFSCCCDNLRETSLHVNKHIDGMYVSWTRTCGLCHQGSNFHWVTKSATDIWALEIRKCKSVCFRDLLLSSFDACLCWPLTENVFSPLCSISQSQWEAVGSRRAGGASLSDTPGFGPVYATASSCDLGHVVNYFDFFEAVCMMVRAQTMESEYLVLNSNCTAY